MSLTRGRTISTISGNFDPEEEKISGWVICKLNVDISEIASMDGKISFFSSSSSSSLILTFYYF